MPSTLAPAASRVPFRLSASPSSIIVGQGTASVLTISVNRSSTFLSSINLSARAARKGVRVIFDENPFSDDDTDITIVAEPSTVLGKTKVTITGRSGRTTSKLSINVTVSATKPDYGIPIPGSTPATVAPNSTPTVQVPTPVNVTAATATPPAVALARGANGTVLLAPSGAKAGTPVTYDVVGLPVGVLPEFFPNGDTVQIRFTISAQTALGTFPLTLRAAQNGLVFSAAAIALTVTADNSSAVTTAPSASSTLATATTTPAVATIPPTAPAAFVTPPLNTTFRLTTDFVSAANKCLEGNNGKADSVYGYQGVPYMSTCGGFTGQMWSATPTDAPGFYLLKTAFAGPALCLAGHTGRVPSGGRTAQPYFAACAGTTLADIEKKNATGQMWKFSVTPFAGRFKLTTYKAADASCLEGNTGSNLANPPLSAGVYWAACGNFTGQLWSFK